MIRTNELRLGNIIEQGLVFRLYDMCARVQASNGRVSYINDEHLIPITLTPEILINAGFELENDSNFTKNYTLPDSRFGYDWHVDTGWWFRYINLRIECKYLHQLQNLYFALTGHELTIHL